MIPATVHSCHSLALLNPDWLKSPSTTALHHSHSLSRIGSISPSLLFSQFDGDKLFLLGVANSSPPLELDNLDDCDPHHVIDHELHATQIDHHGAAASVHIDATSHAKNIDLAHSVPHSGSSSLSSGISSGKGTISSDVKRPDTPNTEINTDVEEIVSVSSLPTK